MNLNELKSLPLGDFRSDKLSHAIMQAVTRTDLQVV